MTYGRNKKPTDTEMTSIYKGGVLENEAEGKRQS